MKNSVILLSPTVKVSMKVSTKISRLLDTTRENSARRYINKKDGYRQQNVRQRQKLISIIDYDVCILE